jgi:hypothetical protein
MTSERLEPPSRDQLPFSGNVCGTLLPPDHHSLIHPPSNMQDHPWLHTLERLSLA